MGIITHASLASYLLRPDLTENATLTLVNLTNRLVAEVTGDISGTTPAGVEAIALEVAARSIRPTFPSSVTISSDNTTKTVRNESVATTTFGGVYLTDDERRRLLALVGKGPARRRPRSIRLHVP